MIEMRLGGQIHRLRTITVETLATRGLTHPPHHEAASDQTDRGLQTGLQDLQTLGTMATTKEKEGQRGATNFGPIISIAEAIAEAQHATSD